ncbi:unnamed protein product [Prunus armeniaca]
MLTYIPIWSDYVPMLLKFDSSKHIFLGHFIIEIDQLYSAHDLYLIQQLEDKPLQEYATTQGVQRRMIILPLAPSRLAFMSPTSATRYTTTPGILMLN